MTLAYLGVGSNLGDRKKNIDEARVLLKKNGVMIKRISPLYETDAVVKGNQSMPEFLNGVFEIETKKEPMELLTLLEEVEKELGRRQKGDWGPRTIDLDLLFYGDSVIDSKRLQVPHPEIPNRWFVLKPLSDLAPDFVHPVLRKTIKELILCNSSSTPQM